MVFTFLSAGRRHNPRLLLFFAGWSAQPQWFCGIAPDGFDLIVATDYRDSSVSLPEGIEEYEEIVVVGWSFGVPAATRFLTAFPQLPVTLRIAVNGTPWPVDDERGIPTGIFCGTLDGLSEVTLRKFDRRMAGSPRGNLYASGIDFSVRRPIETLADELRTVASAPQPEDGACRCWDIALIGDRDGIIPPANQRRAWEGTVATEIIDAPHFPDFGRLLTGRLVDKSLVALRFGRSARESYDVSAEIQAVIARRLAARIIPVLHPQSGKREALQILEVGSGTGQLTRLYTPHLPEGAELTLCDISYVSPALPGKKVVADAEVFVRTLPSESIDLLAGASVIQWFRSPARFVEECRRLLRHGGVMLLSTFAPDNFPELDGLVPHRLGGRTAAEWSKALEPLFPHYSVWEETLPLDFSSPRELLAHMKQTGVTGLSSDVAEGSRSARSIIRAGLTRLTYRPVYLYGSLSD